MRKVEKFTQEDLLRLRHYIFKRISDKEEAEEIFQDVLVSANDSLPLFRRESSFLSWLCAIANHEIVDYYRKKKLKTVLFSRFPFLETIASEALGPDEKLEKEELRKEVKKVLATLSEGYREILRLKYIDELSMKQIARLVKTTVKAVESKLGRAKKEFKKKWTNE